MKCCPMTLLSKIFSAIGAINWGLVAFLKFNLVEAIHRALPIPYLNMLVYAIVGLSGLWLLAMTFMTFNCKTCK